MQECNVDWLDVHSNTESRKDISADLEFIRERLHAIDENGNVQVGIDAFITIWTHSPGERWKASLISLPVIRQLATFGYNIFARLLYKWNRGRGRW